MAFSTGWDGRRTLILGALLSSLWAVLSPFMVYHSPPPFRWLNNKIYDLKLHLFPKSGLNTEIVHLDIDDESIKKYGQWPWDREVSARVVNRITELGAKVIVFDIMYASKGRSIVGDEALANAVAKSGRVVMATAFIESDREERHETPNPATLMKIAGVLEKAWAISAPSQFELLSFQDPRESTIPLLPITKGAKELGHINAAPDEDGIHRRTRLFVKLQDRLVPSLSLAALVAYLDADPKGIIFKRDRIEIHHSGGAVGIPVDLQGRMLVNWPRDVWSSFENYPVWYVLEGKQDAEMIKAFKNKIVIVSIAWTGTTDMGASPVEKQILLSRQHSSALDTMLTGRFIYEVEAFPIPVLVSVIIFLAPLALALRLLFSRAVVLYLALYGIYVLVVIFAFGWKLLDIPMAESSFVFLPAAAGFLISRAISTEKDRRQIRETFGRYMSEDVVEEILKSPGGINLTGEVRDITVLVSDLRGSTPMAAGLEPPEVLTVINRYLDKMVKIVMRHGGTIDEFTGDGIFALFGAPRLFDDAAKRAVQCALDMQKAIPELNKENLLLGLPELRMGIGINSGRLVVGNIGSEERKKYGAIGSAINIAFRVEAQTDRNGGEILITQSVRDRIDGDIELGPSRTVPLKGIEKPMELFPVLGIPETSKPN